MGPREVCFIIGADDAVLWSDASDSPVTLPDSRARWEAIWSRRDVIVEIAHTHPLGGAAFSAEDKSTMVALDSALGRAMTYSVVSPDQMLRQQGHAEACIVDDEPWWVSLIRVASGMEEK